MYESYVLYNFLALCIEYMGGPLNADDHFRRQPPLPHTFPCGCLGTHTMVYFLDACRLFILQYAIVKPVLAILILVLHAQGSESKYLYLKKVQTWMTEMGSV